MNRIRDIASSKGIKQAWLAKQIGHTSQAFYWKIEHDSFNMDEKARLAVALGTSIIELFPLPEPGDPTPRAQQPCRGL